MVDNEPQLTEQNSSRVHEGLSALRRTLVTVGAVLLPATLVISQGGESHADISQASTVQYDGDDNALSPVKTRESLSGFKASTLSNG